MLFSNKEYNAGGPALFCCMSCKLELAVAVYLKRFCEPDDHSCLACQDVLMCHGQSSLRSDRLKLKDWHRALRSSVMMCSGNEMTQM